VIESQQKWYIFDVGVLNKARRLFFVYPSLNRVKFALDSATIALVCPVN